MSEAVLHFFGGKGGAGKTTLATAYAANLADDNPKDKVLLVSIEPVRALSDLLKKKLAAKPTKLQSGKGAGGLFAAELEPASLLEAFVKAYKPALEKAAGASKSAVLTADELAKIFEQTVPGLEEFTALLQLVDWAQGGADGFEKIVVDLSGTAHVLRLFDIPVQLRKFLSLARGDKPGKKPQPTNDSLKALDEIIAQVDKVIATVRDPAKTSFHIVALAEPVPEAQTRLLFAGLRDRQIPIGEIIANQIEDGQGCPACQGRRGLQAPHVRKFQSLDPKGVPVALLQKREVAPRGFEEVKKLAKEWASGKETRALQFSAAEGPPALVRAPSMPPIAAPPLPPTRLIFFVGQGGVGKSSCAAAAAVTLTEKEGPVLLISTDPAHSLSDVLQSRLTDTETQVKGTKGLYARELDVPNWFANLRKRLREKAEKVFGATDAKTDLKSDIPYDREVLRNLMDSAPAGIDELAALTALTDALVQERFKRIVVDPSPTGATFRLIELPEVARGWLTALLNVLVKYRAKGMGELADDVAAMLKHVKRFEEALASPNESRFVVVTRGEELAASKTERLVEYLRGRKLAVERVLVNRVLPKSNECARCENRRKNELLAAKAMEKKLGLPITVAPALGRHPAGLRELKAFRTAWYALSANTKVKAA